MNVSTLNELLAKGTIDYEGMWPRIVEYESKAVRFEFEFGLDSLPTQPGVIIVRGPRQYGKSTWLDLCLRDTIINHGKGTAYYLNGDDIQSAGELEKSIQDLLLSYQKGSTIKRLFVDEIT